MCNHKNLEATEILIKRRMDTIVVNTTNYLRGSCENEFTKATRASYRQEFCQTLVPKEIVQATLLSIPIILN